MRKHVTEGVKVSPQIERRVSAKLSSEELAKQIKEFEANGNKIQQIEQGKSGLDMKNKPVKFI